MLTDTTRPRFLELLREEWPSVPARALAEAGADLDRIVEVLAQHTDHTRALLRLQVAELVVVAERMVAMAAEGGPSAAAGAGGAGPRGSAGLPPRGNPGGAGAPGPDPRIDDPSVLLGHVEAYLWELARAVPHDLATASARGARQHLGVSLSISAALGFLIGLFVGGGARNGGVARVFAPRSPDGGGADVGQ